MGSLIHYQISCPLFEAQQASLGAMKGTSLAGEMLVPASREHRKAIQLSASSVSRVGKVVGRVKAKIYDFASRTYHELLFSEAQGSLFEDVQAEIDSRLAPLGGAALDKVESILSRLAEADAEAVSAAMNSTRRLVDAIADALFPAREGVYAITESQELKVGQGNVLNRLQAYAHQVGASPAQRHRLRRSIGDLYDRASSGVHADVSIAEARFIFLQAYASIGEILSLQSPEAAVTPEG